MLQGLPDTLDRCRGRPVSPELRDAILAFIGERYNASAAAERLFLHRNTMMRRIARAGELLPKPLLTNGIHIAVALEVLHWRGRRDRGEP
ncbi:hypothetical protein HGA11_07625 [Mycolicibacterium septicum DSM 44393]|uniref:PucR C-terminal helix-turn-helix domain-containing protein n=1 Tax=Mycolicibacterium septicum DSM 44393 TaxID=1341646 RepID=A0A7X6MMY8_9MYCO|nr:helix-turn-helix domain-containing protein [Mycolicibacterium septicum]NKZ10846.1 hypothetical protein [Mycolicibacterium septicum DSM 44393]